MLDAPNLDDRNFQDLVDEAKLMVQQRCPAWTNHNVSDPGVTLIETFAFMVDQLLYRLNRVPDRMYVKFLELIGEQVGAAVAARADLTFWLSAPQQRDIVVPVDTVVSTGRRGVAEPVEFSTERPLVIRSCRFARSFVQPKDGGLTDMTEQLGRRGDESAFAAFSDVPQKGDALLIGLDRAVPSAVVDLLLLCHIEGHGVRPERPPIVWQAWTGSEWVRCRELSDGTKGLNEDGAVRLMVPDGHTAGAPGLPGDGLAWLRVLVVSGGENHVGDYTTSPQIGGVQARTVGGTVRAFNAARITDEILGVSDGTAGQRFTLRRRPAVRPPEDEPLVVEVISRDGTTRWTGVDHFGKSGEHDPHVTIDLHAGEVCFGPAVRQADGTVTLLGAIPPRGATITVPSYRVSGGSGGNLPEGRLVFLHSAIPMITRVENLDPAEGGLDAETLEAVKVRGPAAIRTRSRAVTALDYEELARMVAPELRVFAFDVRRGGQPGTVRLLVVPQVGGVDVLGRITLRDLVPDEALVERLRDHLDERRCIGAELVVEPPRYQGVKVRARLTSNGRAQLETIRDAALRALYGLLNPVTGGGDGKGWGFGQPVLRGDLHALLQRVEGCAEVDFDLVAADPLDPITGATGDPVPDRITMPADTLVFSCHHEVEVRAPERSSP